jgi:membrane protein YdbS with pleckstrin-like domain
MVLLFRSYGVVLYGFGTVITSFGALILLYDTASTRSIWVAGMALIFVLASFLGCFLTRQKFRLIMNNRRYE